MYIFSSKIGMEKKEIGTTHFNQHYKKCLTQQGVTGKTQLHFDTSSSNTSSSTLSTWIYSGENFCEEIVKFAANTKLSISIVDNKDFTKFMQDYLQSRYISIIRNTLCSVNVDYRTRKNMQIHDLKNYGRAILIIFDL